jgi:hypothetical protein
VDIPVVDKVRAIRDVDLVTAVSRVRRDPNGPTQDVIAVSAHPDQPLPFLADTGLRRDGEQQEVLREAGCRAVGVEGCQGSRESARWAVAEAIGHVFDGLAGEGALSAVRVGDVEEPGSAPVSAVVADVDGARDAVLLQHRRPTPPELREVLEVVVNQKGAVK